MAKYSKNKLIAEIFPRSSSRQTFTLFNMATLKEKVCRFIAEEWIGKAKSNRQFAEEHTIDEKVVRRILDPDVSGISLQTIERICEAREIKISEFFALIEE